MNPLVSVLITAYNAEKYIAAAVESILSQTLEDFELIVIDDGSTDGTRSILERYVERDRRLQVYDQENLGIVASANRGLELARGKYLARLDADDTSLPSRLAKQTAFLEANPDVVILGSECFLMDESGIVFKASRPPEDDTSIRAAALFDNPFIQSTVMLRREVLCEKRLRYDPGIPLSEDYDLWSHLLLFGGGANLPEPLVCRRMHPEQISEKRQSETIWNAVEIASRNLQRIQFDLPHQEVQELRDWSHDRPVLEDESDWKRVKTVLAILDAFERQPGIDLMHARQIRGRWLLRLLNAQTDTMWSGMRKLQLLSLLKAGDFISIIRYILTPREYTHSPGRKLQASLHVSSKE